MNSWKILVVDDEEGIHGITRMIFRDYEFEQRPVELLSAMNSSQALEQLQQHPDIALILLDVVMETEHAGLQLVEQIRQQLNNADVRIILRTGHPGYAPEAQVIIQYDINDYLSKAELSASRLLTSVIVALRSYRDIRQARTAPPPEADSLPDNPQADLLQAAAEQLQQLTGPGLQQSRRLYQLDLNPVAKELARDLYAHQQRLSLSLQQLQSDNSEESPGAVNLRALLDDVLQIFLPQSRQQGWLLDYRVDENLPEVLNLPQKRFKALLVTSLELAIRQAAGQDLKLRLEQSNRQLWLHTEQLQGQPVYDTSPWAQLLRTNLSALCRQLKGQVTEVDDSGMLCCQLALP